MYNIFLVEAESSEMWEVRGPEGVIGTYASREKALGAAEAARKEALVPATSKEEAGVDDGDLHDQTDCSGPTHP